MIRTHNRDTGSSLGESTDLTQATCAMNCAQIKIRSFFALGPRRPRVKRLSRTARAWRAPGRRRGRQKINPADQECRLVVEETVSSSPLPFLRRT